MNHYILKRKSGVRTEAAKRPNSLVSFAAKRSQSPDPVGSEAFVDAMKRAVTGVNIVTTDGPGGRFGLTVSAFSSVSAEPPMVLVCVNRSSPASAAIMRNKRFAVNVLSNGQRNLADTFAGMPSDGGAYDFEMGSWRSAATGAPLLDHSVASLDCKVTTALDAGTHTIFVGLVRAVQKEDGSPLLYTNRSYGHACSDAQSRN